MSLGLNMNHPLQLAAQPIELWDRPLMNQAKLVFVALPLAATVLIAACSRPDDIRKISGKGFELHVHDHSSSLTRLLAINDKHHVLGMMERPNEDNEDVLDQIYFFHNGKKRYELPMLDGFTNIEALHLSNNALVVGFASRQLGHPDGSLAGILWDPLKAKLSKLGPIKGDNAAIAHSISADGKRITGYSTGANPAKLRPCIWTQNKDQWTATALPTIEQFNPFLMTGSAVISPDGKLIAAAVTEAISSVGVHDSSVFVWQEIDGQWERKLVCKEPLRIHSLNSLGECVGELTLPAGRMPYKVDMDGNLTALPLLEGDTSGEAWGINEQGVVVGISDNLTAADGGPRPVRWVNNKVERIKLPEGSEFGGSYAVNNSGGIAGMTDFPLPDGETKDENDEAELVSRAMGFVWFGSSPQK